MQEIFGFASNQLYQKFNFHPHLVKRQVVVRELSLEILLVLHQIFVSLLQLHILGVVSGLLVDFPAQFDRFVIHVVDFLAEQSDIIRGIIHQTSRPTALSFHAFHALAGDGALRNIHTGI